MVSKGTFDTHILILSIVIMVPENRVFAAGKKEKVYVITKVTVDGGNRVMKYNYSANGLITKVTDCVKSGTHTISYSGTKIKKRTFKDYNYAYGYNNKGQLINVKFSNQWKRDHEYYLTFEYGKNN